MKYLILPAVVLAAAALCSAATAVTPAPSTAQVERADREWALLDAMMGSLVTEAAFMQQDPDVRFWSAVTLRQVRERGLKFFRDNPGDERRWELLGRMHTLMRMWEPLDFRKLDGLWATRKQPNSPVELDEEAREHWRAEWEEVLEAAMKDPMAPVELRVSLECARMQQEMEPYQFGMKSPAEFDWSSAAAKLTRFGEETPENEEALFLNLVSTILHGSRRFAPEAHEEIRAEFLESPNPHVRTIAAADDELAALRHTPLEMKFTAVDGREVDLAKLRGKVVLIDFWAATWCGACKLTEPVMKEVYAGYHDKGFEIIGIACELKESDRAYLEAYVREHDMEWPQLFDSNGMRNEYARRFGFRGIPQFLLLDQRGLLVAHTQGSGGVRNLEAVVRRLLGLPPLDPDDETRELGARN